MGGTSQDRKDGRARRAGPVSPVSSLSLKLMGLTVLFVLLAGVLVLVPALTSYRTTWLQDRTAMAEIAALAARAAPRGQVPAPLQEKLLRSAGVLVVAMKRDGSRQLLLHTARPPMIQARYDLRELTWWRAALDTLATFWHGGERTIVVIDRPPNLDAAFLELAMDERPLHEALVAHAGAWLRHGLMLAMLAGALVYLALHRLLVHPITRLSRQMVRFGRDPEGFGDFSPSGRRDEIGAAEEAFDLMQAHVRETLREKSRLAALGLAVSKISHELRNILLAAQLVSDRLSESADPVVRKLAPKLVSAIDRAISYCSATLKYGRLQERAPRRRRVPLRALVDDVFDSLPPGERAQVSLHNEVPPRLHADSDPEQLHRALFNLARNACQAIANARRPGEVRISARRHATAVEIIVADTGPGLPRKARAHLFEPFLSAARSGGTGLGLSITREIVELHGGSIRLREEVETDEGAVFEIIIPDRMEAVRNEQAANRRRA